MEPVFSLNFSSAGKGPFVDSKAKNIYFSPGGRGGSGVRDMDPPSLGNLFIPIFSDLQYRSHSIIEARVSILASRSSNASSFEVRGSSLEMRGSSLKLR